MPRGTPAHTSLILDLTATQTENGGRLLAPFKHRNPESVSLTAYHNSSARPTTSNGIDLMPPTLISRLSSTPFNWLSPSFYNHQKYLSDPTLRPFLRRRTPPLPHLRSHPPARSLCVPPEAWPVLNKGCGPRTLMLQRSHIIYTLTKRPISPECSPHRFSAVSTRHLTQTSVCPYSLHLFGGSRDRHRAVLQMYCRVT